MQFSEVVKKVREIVHRISVKTTKYRGVFLYNFKKSNRKKKKCGGFQSKRKEHDITKFPLKKLLSYNCTKVMKVVCEVVQKF